MRDTVRHKYCLDKRLGGIITVGKLDKQKALGRRDYAIHDLEKTIVMRISRKLWCALLGRDCSFLTKSCSKAVKSTYTLVGTLHSVSRLKLEIAGTNSQDVLR